MKNKIFKAVLAVAVCFAAIFCSSCNNFGGIDSLLEPPKLTSQQEEIRLALEKSLGTSEIYYRYPISGKNRTAITMRDIYGDERQEAIVLYGLGADSADSRVHILTVDDLGQWITLCDIAPGAGNSIDRIDFSRVKPTGYDQLLIGWRLFSGNVLSIYDVQGGTEQELAAIPYSEVVAADLDSDLDSELVIFSANSDTATTNVRVYNHGTAPSDSDYLQNSGAVSEIYLMTEASMKAVTSFLQVKYAKLADNIPAIFVDAQISSNTYITEILCFTNNHLQSVFSGDPATRTIKIVSRDVDSDGFVEAPVTQLMYGYETAAASDRLSSVSWYGYLSNFTGATNCTTVVNTSWNYMVMLKPEWIKDVTVESVSNPSEWTFCHYDFEMSAFGDRIVTIRAWIDSDWEGSQNIYPQQQVFATRGNTVFTAEIFNYNEITLEELEDLFIILE